MLTIRRTRLGTASLATAALLMTACHTYTPVTTQGVTPGARLQARLTDRGAADLAQYVGPYARIVEGRVTQATDSVLVMSVTELTRANGVEETWRGESVTLNRNSIADLSVPKVSRTRSILLAGGIVAALVGIGLALGTESGVSGKGPGTSNPGQQ